GHLSRNQMAAKNHTHQQQQISRHVPLLSLRTSCFRSYRSRVVATSEKTGGTSPALPRLSRNFFFFAFWFLVDISDLTLHPGSILHPPFCAIEPKFFIPSVARVMNQQPRVEVR